VEGRKATVTLKNDTVTLLSDICVSERTPAEKALYCMIPVT
jgi:hypothetical protein